MKKCSYCQKLFTPTEQEKSCCSPKCRLKRRLYYEKNKRRIYAKQLAYQHKNRKILNEKRNKRLKEKRRLLNSTKPPIIRVCIHCGQYFIALYRSSRCCSQHCQTKYKHQQLVLFRKLNKESIAAQQKKYHQSHKEQINAWTREYAKQRRKTNAAIHIHHSIVGRIAKMLKGKVKSAHTLELLDCSITFLKLWLELQFKPGMSWENYGLHGWHVDHIRPCASFDLRYKDQQQGCFHYTNLQPLWAKENLIKSDKYF